MSHVKYQPNSYHMTEPTPPKRLDGLYKKKKLAGCPVCKGTHHPLAFCPGLPPIVFHYKPLGKQTK